MSRWWKHYCTSNNEGPFGLLLKKKKKKKEIKKKKALIFKCSTDTYKFLWVYVSMNAKYLYLSHPIDTSTT
jgi:hypothetical protein